MKRNSTRLLSSFLALCLTFSMCSPFASAANTQTGGLRSSNYLDSYMAGVTVESDGTVTVTVDVTAVKNCTKIGARDIYLYESTDGKHFTCVKTFNYLDYPKMVGSGFTYARDAVSYSGIPGRYYFANVYVYAADSSGSASRLYSTSPRH